MLVLDEQLLGRSIEHLLGQWYRGPVLFITDLRPNTVIKDEAIPLLLRQQDQATFITINETDFWQKVRINPHFCLICVALSDAQVPKIPALVRSVFRIPRFRTKAARIETVLRVTQTTVSYYTYQRSALETMPLESE